MHTSLRSSISSVSAFAREHDDLPAFNAAYWVLTFLAAMLFNAGAFLLLIAGHIVLDIYKYRSVHRQRWSKAIAGVFHENILDVSMLSLSITFGVYYHVSMPLIAGMRGLLRAEISMMNAIVQVLVKVHILHRFMRILANRSWYLGRMHPQLGKRMHVLEHVAYLGLIASVALILASPWILGLDAEHVRHLASDLLVPWQL